MRSFEALIKDIEKNKVLANKVLDKPDPRTYTTQLGHIKRAKENLSELYLEYRKEVMQRAVFILAKGAQSKSFIDIAEKEGYGCFDLNADSVYEEIADKVNERYYDNQQSSPALFDILMSSFNDVCDDIGIIGYPAVLFESKYRRRLKSKKDLVDLVKQAYNDKVGSELVGLYAVEKIARKAVNEGYSGKTIPIILHSKDKDLLDTLETSLKEITVNVFKIATSSKQNKKLVEQKLLKIKDSIK